LGYEYPTELDNQLIAFLQTVKNLEEADDSIPDSADGHTENIRRSASVRSKIVDLLIATRVQFPPFS
jgi:hypothetical protein